MTVRQRLWVAALAVGLGRPALLGGSSALAVLGMRGLDARKIHVLVGAVDMAPVLARMTHVKRRRVIVEAVADAAGGAESIAEVDFARICRRGRLPEPSRQAVRVDGAGGRRYRDVYFDDWRLHVEIDGAQHMDVRSWYADMTKWSTRWRPRYSPPAGAAGRGTPL
jgi:hypothetical protein